MAFHVQSTTGNLGIHPSLLFCPPPPTHRWTVDERIPAGFRIDETPVDTEIIHHTDWSLSPSTVCPTIGLLKQFGQPVFLLGLFDPFSPHSAGNAPQEHKRGLALSSLHDSPAKKVNWTITCSTHVRPRLFYMAPERGGTQRRTFYK